MKYRNRTDITAQILEVAASGPVTKSMIMYKAFLSSNHLKEYLRTLMEKGLLTYIPAENKYKTTEKGIVLLKMMDELSRFINSTSYEIRS
jgi:predicted transcriptional regulator